MTADVEEVDDDDLEDGDLEDEDDGEDGEPEEEDESAAIVSSASHNSRTIASDDDRPPVGSWWWVTSNKSSRSASDYDEPGRRWLACVIEVGSNYAKVEGVHLSWRIALDDFHRHCKSEPDPDPYIAGKLGFYKNQVRELMREIQQVCHRLGVPMRQALAESETPTTQALAVVHGVDNVKKYGKDLVKAKDKTLPELFAKVKEQHEQMAKWMKADLIPAKAELTAVQEVVEVIEHKIHTVELYAGLQEQLVQVRKGEPADADAKVHLMQRRHYMDEECLVAYEAGGMDFQGIRAFDKWMARDENFRRILPHDRTIVAFRIRRNDKEYGGTRDTLANFITFAKFNEANKATFLYIRNGDQLWRMETSIQFDEELFAGKADSELLNNSELWLKEEEYCVRHRGVGESDGILTTRQRNAMIDKHKARRDFYAQKLWQWHRAGKPEGNWLYIPVGSEFDYAGMTKGVPHSQTGKPYKWHDAERDPTRGYVMLTPQSIYYDDVMKRIREVAFKHNHVAVVIQGLLDRSTCLHPHAPWRIWTPEGFAAGIELVFDVKMAITSGDVPDFEVYRAQLNKSIRVGCHTIGQKRAWRAAMETKYGDRWRSNGRVGEGPKPIDVVRKVWRDGDCDFEFKRDRVKPVWVSHPEKRGYMQAKYPEVPMTWRCPGNMLFCVDAYLPGDFHLFYDDPRTRADYLQWAPFLLAAEDWHHKHQNEAPQVKVSKVAPQVEDETVTKERDKDELTEREWKTVFAARCKSKHGQLMSDDDRALCNAAFESDPDRYAALDKEVFNATTPFGSTKRV